MERKRTTNPMGLDVVRAEPDRTDRIRVLTLATSAFTLLFAVWVMFGFLSIPIRKELHLSEVQMGWLVSVAVLSGSLLRLSFGIWADRWGGRRVMVGLLLASALPCAAVSYAHSYVALCTLALLFGVAGNSFTVGVSWVSAWFPHHAQGSALGVFGAGNVGASLTKLVGPALIAMVSVPLFSGLVPAGWRFIPLLYAVLLVLFAALVWFLAPSRDRMPGRGRPLMATLAPLREVRVWRFSLYYVVVFGAYVALSVWLPKYYVDVYRLPLVEAAKLTALFIFPASLLRPLGGWLSDKYGARKTLYWVLGTMAAACAILAVPSGTLSQSAFARLGLLAHDHGLLELSAFTVVLLVVGIGMGIGKAAVYKFVPQYYPKDVGAVGGLVGMLGALGGFFLPPIFAYTRNVTGSAQTVFAVLLMLVLASLAWLHLTVTRMNAANQRASDASDELESVDVNA
jgi:MFS transporter, NNP family, nitrate/nitrite transporter